LSSNNLLQIGDAAERVGLSLRTVRYWEEIGLVEPESRSKGGFRLYSEADLARLLVVKAMKPLGLTLEQMREILDLVHAAEVPNPSDEVVARIETYTRLVQEKVDHLERYLEDARVLQGELVRAVSRVQAVATSPSS
jgi:MerR family copper efflux transcriptional regulator